MKFILSLFTSLILVFGSNSFAAAPIISGISTNEINIDTDFQGTKILLFGAKGDAGDIVVALRGPKKNFIVTKKQSFLGFWHNGKRIKFKDSYSFYALFSTFSGSRAEEKLLRQLEIGKSNLEFEASEEEDIVSKSEFKVQLIDNLERKKLYKSGTDKVDFLDETLFKVVIDFPKNIPRGVYSAEIYLINDGNLISFQSIPIYVNQVGFSARILDFAYQEPFLYGLLSVLIALIFGWIADYVFNRFFGK
jgi:uncharacterized protein (TIGR02186 family)